MEPTATQTQTQVAGGPSNCHDKYENYSSKDQVALDQMTPSGDSFDDSNPWRIHYSLGPRHTSIPIPSYLTCGLPAQCWTPRQANRSSLEASHEEGILDKNHCEHMGCAS